VERESSSYEYLFVGGPNHSYTFKSQFEASYEVKFKPGPELVDDPAFEEYIFEMVIVLIDNPYTPRLPPANVLMSVTIARIVDDFFQVHQRAIVYICDDSDSRADSRRKLSDRWHRRFGKLRYTKMSVGLGTDQNGVEYSAEFVSRVDSPFMGPFYESFRRTVSQDNRK